MAETEAQAYAEYRSRVDDTTPVWETGSNGTYTPSTGAERNSTTFTTNVTLEMDGETISRKTVHTNQMQQTLAGPSAYD